MPESAELEFDPSSEYRYRNFNYILLGYALEQATGTLWEDFLVREVFAPLGMGQTRYDDVYAIVSDRARGYDREDGKLRNSEYEDHAAYSAGGLRSTTGDLFRWFRRLIEGRIVGQDYPSRAFQPYQGYGYGWRIREFFDRTIYNHTGAIEGFASHLAFYPDADLLIIALSNIESEPAVLRACDIAKIMFGGVDSARNFQAWKDLTPAQGYGLSPTQ